jgi:hypothetical protein
MRILHSRLCQEQEFLYALTCFIFSWVINPPPGLRTVKNLASDVDSKITEYEGTFDKLRLLFLERAALQTEVTVLQTNVTALQTNITVLRILDAVQDLGVQPHCLSLLVS